MRILWFEESYRKGGGKGEVRVSPGKNAPFNFNIFSGGRCLDVDEWPNLTIVTSLSGKSGHHTSTNYDISEVSSLIYKGDSNYSLTFYKSLHFEL